ncbi:hypothetical protein MCEMSEM23_00682 [Rhabdaerophilaceae bacterium]
MIEFAKRWERSARARLAYAASRVDHLAASPLSLIWQNYSAFAERYYDRIVIAATILALLIHAAIPSGPVSQNMMDLFTFIDGAYRIESGQIPHVDFISSLGSGTYLIYVIARQFVADGLLIFWSNLVFWVLCLPVVFWLPQILPASRALPVVVVAFVAVMIPVNIDFGFQCGFNYNTGYNRWGAALLLLYFSSLFGRSRDLYSSPFVDALVLVYAFLIKINFFAVVAVALVLLALLRGRNRIPALYAFGIFFLVLMGLELGFSMVSGYFRDLGSVAAVNQGAIVPMLMKAIRANLLQCIAMMLVILGLALAALRPALDLFWRRPFSLGRALVLARPNLLVGYVLTTSLVSESQNLGGIGMVPALALLASGLPLPRLMPAFPWVILRTAVAASILVPWLVISAHNMGCLAKQVGLQRAQRSFTDIAPDFASFAANQVYIAEQFNPEMLERERRRRDWILHLDPRLYVFYMREISDLLAVLRVNYSSPITRTLDFADPIPALLGSKPARGSYIAMHHLRTISPASYVAPDKLFAGVNLVLAPTCALFELNNDMVKLYEPYLRQNFREVRLTRCWRAFERSTP